MKNFIFLALTVFFISSCEESNDHIKDWTDDPKYDSSPSD
jgi:hypothetical protein